MTDATAQRIIKERFGPDARGRKRNGKWFRRMFPAYRIAVEIKSGFWAYSAIGFGPTWEHAIIQAENRKGPEL